ncbi:MAG: metallophosphoesterase [Clostridia bacterium]|nr:metallophosphoesterase [Clostridia bacterium]
MKKIISLLLSVIMVFSLVSTGFSVSAEGEELRITVANDLHYNPYYDSITTKYTEDYQHVPGNGQLWIESLLIVDTFFKEFAENDSEILLIPGDLVDHGTAEEHAEFSAYLAKYETEKKRIYVVPGNHDYYRGATPEQFASYYAEFGYNEAIAKDTASASYVVDLNDEYRLLAIDSCVPGGGNAGIDEGRKAWIAEQAEQAQKDGKKLISMMHHNLLDHFVFGSVIHPGAFVDSAIGLPELYAQYNIKYNFVGHTHAQDIMAYTGSNGVTVYDVLTSSLNLYPLPYRNVVFGKDVKISTKKLETVDNLSEKKDVLSDNCYALASEDFQAYALKCAEYGLDSVISSYANAEKIKELLKIDTKENKDVAIVIDNVADTLIELIDMPLYIKDAGSSASLESYANQINLDFPETDMHSFRELAIFFYQQFVEGDENYGFLSTEFVLLTAVMNTILNRLLASVSAEDYATLLNYLANYFNLEIQDLAVYAGSAVSRIKGIDIFVSALADVAFLQFTTDELPADNNATLPAYDEPVVKEETLSLFDKIIRFFKDLFNNFLRFFSLGL